jgi:hypothetical protein
MIDLEKSQQQAFLMTVYYTQEEVAGFFKVTVQTIKSWRQRDPTFPAPFRGPMGKGLLWKLAELSQWADDNRVQKIIQRNCKGPAKALEAT